MHEHRYDVSPGIQQCTFFFLFFFLLLNSVYTVLPLSQGLDRVKGGTMHMKIVVADLEGWGHTCPSPFSQYLTFVM